MHILIYFWWGKWGFQRCDIFWGHIQRAEFQNHGCLGPLPQSNAFPLSHIDSHKQRNNQVPYFRVLSPLDLIWWSQYPTEESRMVRVIVPIKQTWITRTGVVPEPSHTAHIWNWEAKSYTPGLWQAWVEDAGVAKWQGLGNGSVTLKLDVESISHVPICPWGRWEMGSAQE